MNEEDRVSLGVEGDLLVRLGQPADGSIEDTDGALTPPCSPQAHPPRLLSGWRSAMQWDQEVMVVKSLAEARIKRNLAVKLAAEGRSFDEIAQEVGFTHRGSAHRAVYKALDEHEVENVDHLRDVEGTRLDALLAALWPRIEQGDVKAINVALRITDARLRLFGLVPKTTAAHQPEFMSLVVPAAEGNPRQATLDDVRRWSAAAKASMVG